MGIHDKIGPPSSFRKWNVFLINDQSTNTFLSMPTGELISKLWASHLPDDCFDNFGGLFVSGDNDAINVKISAGRLEA